MDNPFSATPDAAPAVAQPTASDPPTESPPPEEEVEVTLPTVGGISHHSVPAARITPRATQEVQAAQQTIQTQAVVAPAAAPPAEPVPETVAVATTAPVENITEPIVQKDPFGSPEILTSPRVLFADDPEEEDVQVETPPAATPVITAEPPVEVGAVAPASTEEFVPLTQAAPVEPQPASPEPVSQMIAEPEVRQASDSEPLPAEVASPQDHEIQPLPVTDPATATSPAPLGAVESVPATVPVAEAAPAETGAPVAETAAPVAEAPAPIAEAAPAETAAPVAEAPAPIAEAVPHEKVAEPAPLQVEPAPTQVAPVVESIAPIEQAQAPVQHHVTTMMPAPVAAPTRELRSLKPDGEADSLSMEEVSCRTCKYLDFDGEDRTRIEAGECRRMAPVPGSMNEASWPSVLWDTWCGEWDLGVSDDDMVRMARDVAEGINAKINEDD